MEVAYVLLYLTFPAGVVQVPEKFPTMEACEATFEGVRSKGTGSGPWGKSSNGIPIGTCVTVTGS